MRSLLRILPVAVVALTVAARTPAQTTGAVDEGYIVILEPREWTGEGVRGLTLSERPLDVVGLAHHRSGIVRVTVNGKNATLTRNSSGVTRFSVAVPAEARREGVEVIAFPANGTALTRRYGRAGPVAASPTPPRPAAATAPAPSPAGGSSAAEAATLRVSVADLPSSARSSVAASLRAVPSVVVSSRRRDPAHLTIRREGEEFVVVGMDGAVRHRVAAPTPAAGAAALAPLLREEQGARRLAEIAAPAGAAPLQFSFLRARSSFRVNESIELRVRAGLDGYLTVVDLGTNGTVTVLFPTEHDRGNLVRRGQEVIIPTPEMRRAYGEEAIRASEPVGRGVVRAFITPRPLVITPPGGTVQAETVIQALREAIETTASGSAAAPLWTTAVLFYEITR
ncbi:MAG TPA: DUF4384 domain-containing protein [Longimicrobiaceae bacterium]|nr:DUF4384 domain-containing protein [Longimicrobiaceae bacterium]